jgi:hypothetical protein
MYAFGLPAEQHLILDGYCTYQNMTPVNPLSVNIVNVNTGKKWTANINNNYYSLMLTVGRDVNATETLRYIALDSSESVNVTDHVVTSNEINAGAIHLNLIVKIHYRDLKKFPFYISQVNTGAMTMKMMMDYLMWNRTINPQGPPSVYSEQTLYNTYKGNDAIINATELWTGLNTEVDDQHHNWMYGYFFNPFASTNANDVLKTICIWLDYNVSYYNNLRDPDVPKPGHPWHVPIAVPCGGNYNNWMVVRGIHTNKTAWLPPTALTVYGFWLNDPKAGGLGNNTYVTVSRFLSTYFLNLSVPGDQYNGKRLAITDPPRDIPINTDDVAITFTIPKTQFTIDEAQIVAQKKGADTIIVRAGYNAAWDVLKNDPVFADSFTKATVTGKPIFKDTTISVKFVNKGTSFTILLQKETGSLLEIQIKNGITLSEKI